jgi:3-hydroxyisobutyrate dehydrogenase-like beta-hydroxyacid dehydrogenase
VTVARTPAAAVGGASVVICMLADGAVTQAVLLDEALLAALPDGVVVCDMGTSGVETAKMLEAGLTRTAVRFVDAPVSGSVMTISSGQLLVMASGDEAGVDLARPILESFAKKVVYLGAAGAGQAMKLSVNLVVHTLNAAVSEALTLAINAGVPAASAYDIFEDSVVAAPFVVYKRGAFLDPAVPVAMSLDLTRKDLGLIAEFADGLGSPALAAHAVLDEVALACDAGFGAQDMAALGRFLQQASGTPA